MTAIASEGARGSARSRVGVVPQGFSSDSGSRRAERIRLFVQPIVVILVVAGVLIWAFSSNLDSIEQQQINASNIFQRLIEHIELTVTVAAIVLVVAVPLGIMVTRRWAKFAAPLFIGIANIGQAAPSIGVLVLFFLWTNISGFWAAVVPIAFYSLLPVLRNTMVGLQQVDPTLVEAGKGIGMSSGSVLRRIELPLAVPLILAGLRTSLVLAVGTATLAFLVNGGGLGLLIDSGYKLTRYSVLIVGAVLPMALALLVDWLGAMAERWLGPKGLR